MVYRNNKRLTAITAIPDTRPYIDRWCSPYFSAEGRSSSREIKTIIPATAAKIIPKTISFINGIKIRYPIKAPIGSDRPDRKEYKKAFFLLPVA
jgi:hypothetical protein